LALVVVALSVVVGIRAKDADEIGPYRLITTILVPGFGNGFDISWVDSEAGRYYLTDRGNATATPPVPPRIDVIDTRRLKLLAPIPTHAAGNGVVAIRTSHDGDDSDEGANELWVGDSKSNVEVIDLASRSIVADIFTGGTGRADELAYDPRDHIVIVANDQDTPPFVTFISTTTRTVLGSLAYPQAVFGTPREPRARAAGVESEDETILSIGAWDEEPSSGRSGRDRSDSHGRHASISRSLQYR
jgi:hypothetical protein